MRPSLLLDFASTRRLDPRIAFTRASVGTYFDRNGVLKTAAVNEPRFDFDPVTGYCKGLLIEEARTNLLSYSEQFDNAVWAKTRATITPNAAVAPDGMVAADKLVEDTQTGFHFVSVAGSRAEGETISVFAKAAERTKVGIYRGANSVGACFDLVAGTVAAVDAKFDALIQPLPGGWYRCALTIKTGTGQTGSYYIAVDLGYQSSYAGDGASGVYLWGAQDEVGKFPTSYIPTTSAPVTRSAEVVSIAAGNFSPWFNPAEGTLLVAASRRALDATRSSHLVNISDGTTANSFILHVDSLAKRSFSVDAGASSSCALLSGDEVASTPWRAAAAYRTGDFALSINGAAVVTDSSGPLPPVNQMWLGNRADGARAYNGHLSRVAYYPRRIANADLQELTR